MEVFYWIVLEETIDDDFKGTNDFEIFCIRSGYV